jgi:hypothetical protein
MGKPRLTLLVLALACVVLPKTLSACGARVGAPRASEVEILECISPDDYFESHYEQLHPLGAPAGRSEPRKVFEGQLANQPGVVLRVKMLRYREYGEPDAKTDHYRWTSRWRKQEPAKETLLYLRQRAPTAARPRSARRRCSFCIPSAATRDTSERSAATSISE